MPTFSFKEEGTSSDTKQIWNLLSKQILTPFAPKFKIYNYQKFLPKTKNANGAPSVDISHCPSPRRSCSKIKFLNSFTGFRLKGGEEPLVSTSRRRAAKKASVRFDLRVASPRDRDVSSLLRQPELVTEGDKENGSNTGKKETSNKPRYLSFQDLDLPNTSIEKPASRQRKNSMFEHPIERLLDDVDGNATYIKSPGDDRSEKDTQSTSNYKPKSCISDIDLSIIRRTRRRDAAAPVVQQEKKIDYNQIYPIRRRSCTCRDCGANKKLIKSNTIFLAEDFELLRRNLRKNEDKGRKPDLITIFGRKFRHKTSISGGSDQPPKRKLAKKMLQILQINSVLRRFAKRPQGPSTENDLEGAITNPTVLTSEPSFKASRCDSLEKESSVRMENGATNNDKLTYRSHENLSVSGNITNRNESCYNTSRLVSPLPRAKQNELIFIAQHSEDSLSSDRQLDRRSLNELSEDFGQVNNLKPSDDQPSTLLLESASKAGSLCEVTSNVIESEILQGKYKSAAKVSLRGMLNTPDHCLPMSTDITEADVTNDYKKSVLGMKKLDLNSQNSLMSTSKTKAQTNEFERQVREVIQKTRKHIGLKPLVDENSFENNDPKWILSPKSCKLPSLE